MGRRALQGATMLLMMTMGTVGSTQETGPPPGGPQGGRPGLGIPPNLARVLELTEEQQAAVHALRKEEREAAQPLLEELRGLDAAFREALAGDKPDALAVGKAAIAQHAARERLKAQHEGFRARLLELLDDEQRQKLESMGEGAQPGRARAGRPGSPRGRR